MKLKELLSNLSYLYLSNTASTYSGEGDIRECDLPKYLVAINEGLNHMYSRYLNKTGNAYFVPDHNRFTYLVDKSDAAMMFDTPPDEVMKILSVERVLVDGDFNNRVMVRTNDVESEYPLFIYPPNRIEITKYTPEYHYFVRFQAGHRRLTASDMESEIDLPSYLMNPLCLYVDYLINSAMNREDITPSVEKKLARFDVIMMGLERDGLLIKNDSNGLSQFSNKGFV